ncbi:sensor histidine kinase [Spiractinospora alimapuensis]|uniref:sensor histidine kinase n=1 Tax=Spiractinospora alimapuensis TaxID=2820884 RepID=UPI001F2DF278|nr:histidine kinase [Spiractinospora alimapuensis]QVQ53788.1 sensor histidine kinase [Spiractinospora alimapuensis]
MTTEQARDTQVRLRKLTASMVTGAISAIGALQVASDADSVGDGLILGAGVLATLVVLTGWASGWLFRVLLPGLVATAAVWLLGVLLVDAPTASYGFAIVATIAVVQLPTHRQAVISGVVAFVLAGLVAKLLVSDVTILELVVQYLLVSAAVSVGGVVLTLLLSVVQGVIGELEKAREREAELAVMRERVRFAGDLHDIQGHTLHVVKLKITLARRLLHSDLARVERELREVHGLVGDTITETRDLAYAERRLNLSAELENAKNLFEAAGIRVSVDRSATADPHLSEMLGQVLRETTTNILRHSEATRVWITQSRAGLAIVNDGAPAGDTVPELRGLSTLTARVAGDGGELTVERRDGRFHTSVTYPARPTPGIEAGDRPTREDDR